MMTVGKELIEELSRNASVRVENVFTSAKCCGQCIVSGTKFIFISRTHIHRYLFNILPPCKFVAVYIAATVHFIWYVKLLLSGVGEPCPFVTQECLQNNIIVNF